MFELNAISDIKKYTIYASQIYIYTCIFVYFVLKVQLLKDKDDTKFIY